MRTRMARHLDALSALSREAPDQHLQRAATLAGRAATPVDLPPEFSWHDYAIFLLSTAAEIEHVYLDGAAVLRPDLVRTKS